MKIHQSGLFELLEPGTISAAAPDCALFRFLLASEKIIPNKSRGKCPVVMDLQPEQKPQQSGSESQRAREPQGANGWGIMEWRGRKHTTRLRPKKVAKGGLTKGGEARRSLIQSVGAVLPAALGGQEWSAACERRAGASDCFQQPEWEATAPLGQKHVGAVAVTAVGAARILSVEAAAGRKPREPGGPPRWWSHPHH